MPRVWLRGRCCALFLGLLATAPAHGTSLAIGRGSRPHNLDLALRVGPFEAEYLDEGEQPYGIPDINRIVNLDLLAHTDGRLAAYAKAGLSSSRLSYNGGGNGYPNHTGFTGENAGVGLDAALTQHFGVRLQWLWMRYQQCSVPDYETFSTVTLSAVWTI